MDVTPFWQPFQNVMALQRATADRRYDTAQNNVLMDMKRQEFDLRQRQNALQMETLEDQRAAQMQAQQRQQAFQQRVMQMGPQGMTPQGLQALAMEFPDEAKALIGAWKDTRPEYTIEGGQYIPKDPGYGIGAQAIQGYREPLPKMTGAAANLANILGRTPTQDELFNYERSIAAAGATRVSNTNITNTKGQDKVDTSYAPEYVKNIVEGGIGDTLTQVESLENVAARLRGGEKLSGRMFAVIPESVLPVSHPQVAAARDDVLNTVQRSLREILGAQFTEKEGALLLKRAYDVRLPPEENARRVERLARQLRVAAEAKASAARYFEERGTLTGYRGKVYTMQDFLGDRVPVRTPPREGGNTGGARTQQGGKADPLGIR
jgi:hypothetical protein